MGTDLSQAIIVQARAEKVEIINDSAETCKCPKCGKLVMISAGMIFDQQIHVRASNAPVVCDCGTQLTQGG